VKNHYSNSLKKIHHTGNILQSDDVQGGKMKKGTIALFGLAGMILIAGLLLSGCAGVETSMNSWMGTHQSELIKSWGPPQQEYSDGKGGKILDPGQKPPGFQARG
jgi:hypothetical protein